MIRNLTNISAQPVVLEDMHGLLINPNATVNGLAFDDATLMNSSDLMLHILQNQVSVNDGVKDYFGMDAVNMLKGLTTQYTKDGKQIITSSDRPSGYYRHFTGKGDDVLAGKIGQGAPIHMIAEPGQTATIDVHFVDDVYIRDGKIRYLNAGFDSHLNIDVVCPPNIPFPSPTNTGTLDNVNGKFVPNTTGTGAYMTAPVEVVLFRFINAMHLVGDNELDDIDSPEPFMMYFPYFLRMSINADANITGQLKAAVTVGMFRKKTV